MKKIQISKLKATETNPDACTVKGKIYYCIWCDNLSSWINVNGSGDSYTEDLMEQLKEVTFVEVKP